MSEASRPPSSANALLAAQPIYDRENRIDAVELLYRNDTQQSAMEVGEQTATSELLFNLCAAVTDEYQYYHVPAFINVSADFLQSGAFLPIDPDRVVIELVERIDPTPEVIAAVKAWHKKGFRFALDDFEFTPAWAPLLPYADVIKVDILNESYEDVLRHRERLAYLDCKWLAERVEDRATLRRYHDAGFDLFQGYFLAYPEIVYGKKLTSGALHLTRVISELYSAEPDIDALAASISHDPGLAVSLLRVVNSPIFRGHKTVTSVREVVVRLGLEKLRRWVVLISAVNASSPEAARLILTRAQFCLELALRKKINPMDVDQAFLVGLLSGVDVLLGVEHEAFLDQLDMLPDVHAAILSGTGELGRVLALALKLEKQVALKTNLSSLDERLLRLYHRVSHDVQTLLAEGD
ncbi:MAG: HDOD domain-containing protein [Natronospirillum sp.]